MSLEKLLEGIRINENLKFPFLQLLRTAFDRCDELQLKYKLNRLALRITTDINRSFDSDLYGAGAHICYKRINDLCFEVEIAVPKQIDSLVGLYFVAHEIGHLMKDHALYFLEGKEKPPISPLDVEVEADQWAVQFFYDEGLKRSKDVEEAIRNNLISYFKPGEIRDIVFIIK